MVRMHQTKTETKDIVCAQEKHLTNYDETGLEQLLSTVTQ